MQVYFPKCFTLTTARVFTKQSWVCMAIDVIHQCDSIHIPYLYLRADKKSKSFRLLHLYRAFQDQRFCLHGLDKTTRWHS